MPIPFGAAMTMTYGPVHAHAAYAYAYLYTILRIDRRTSDTYAYLM